MKLQTRCRGEARSIDRVNFKPVVTAVSAVVRWMQGHACHYSVS